MHTAEGCAKIGSKCDVQFICLHAGEYKKANGVGFLREWIAAPTRVVCALENSKARALLQGAILKCARVGDSTMQKIAFASEQSLSRLFEPDSTRGFYALAFALQARARLDLGSPVFCLGFGRRGHEGAPEWPMGHNHADELILWIDLWKRGESVQHLEWDEFSRELMASAFSRRYFRAVPRMRLLSHEQLELVIGKGLANLRHILAVAAKDPGYCRLSTEKLMDMASHGLIIHPDAASYLTCGVCRNTQKKLYKWQSVDGLVAHFHEGHKERYMAWRRESSEVDPPEDFAAWMSRSDQAVDLFRSPCVEDLGRSRREDGVGGDARGFQRGALGVGGRGTSSRPRGSVGRVAPNFPTTAAGSSEDEWELWSWIRMYAAFQSALDKCQSTADPPRSVINTCRRTLEVLQEGAPGAVLAEYRTSKKSTWNGLVQLLHSYFSSWGRSPLVLQGESITLGGLAGCMSGGIKYVLNTFLGRGEEWEQEVVKAVVCLNEESKALGGQFYCLFQRAQPCGTRDAVTIRLTGRPDHKYSGGTHRPTRTQLLRSQLESHVVRSSRDFVERQKWPGGSMRTEPGKNVVVVAEGMRGYLVHEVFKFDFRAAGELYTIQMG